MSAHEPIISFNIMKPQPISVPTLPQPCWITLKDTAGLCHFTRVKCFLSPQHSWESHEENRQGRMFETLRLRNEVLGIK